MFSNKTKIEIKTLFGTVRFSHEAADNTIKKTLEAAVAARADLKGAYLEGADLKGADLEGADLKGADLEGADLKGAYLKGADLKGAYLKGADLKGAYLEGADLKGAYLKGADLEGADLRGVKNLPESYINICSRDILFVLSHLKSEVPALRQAIVEGRVDGTQYEGDCACLIGSLANISKKSTIKVCDVIPFYKMGLHNPGEQWFWQIRKGDTPENNTFAAHAVKLCDMVVPPMVPAKKRTTKKRK
jgi:hypothetical protein